MSMNSKQIIAALPSKSIELVGLAAERNVYLNGVYLDPAISREVRDYSQTFNWGFDGVGVTQLSLAVLTHFIKDADAATEDTLLYFASLLKSEFFSHLDGGNFRVKVNVQAMVDTLQNSPKIALNTVYVSDEGVVLAQVADFSKEFEQIPAYSTINQYVIDTSKQP